MTKEKGQRDKEKLEDTKEALVSWNLSLSFGPFHFVIVLSVLLFRGSDYLFGTFKVLFVLLPFTFCHCIVCPSSIYGFWLPLWYLQDSLCKRSLKVRKRSLEAVNRKRTDNTITKEKGQKDKEKLEGTKRLPLWYLQASFCPFALFSLSLYCLSFSYLRLQITSLVSSSFSLSFCPFHFVIVLSVVLLFTASDKGKSTKRNLKIPKM
jgi:uncharacterized membrane protein